MAESMWFKPYLPQGQLITKLPGVPNSISMKTGRSLFSMKKNADT